MPDWFYVSKDGERVGPADEDILEGLWEAGELDGLTQMSSDGVNFLPLAEIDVLRTLFARSPPVCPFNAPGGGDDDEDFDDVDEPVATAAPDEQVDVPKEASVEAEAAADVPRLSGPALLDGQWREMEAEGRKYFLNIYSLESAWEKPLMPDDVGDTPPPNFTLKTF
jgi:hypothetical protein